MNARILWTFLATALLVLVLAACGSPASEPLPGTGSQETPGSGDEMPAPVASARAWLAAKLGVAVDQVEIAEFAQEDWTDSCLGLGGPAESCLQAITSGWQVTLMANGQEFEVRTDATGEVLRSPQFPN